MCNAQCFEVQCVSVCEDVMRSSILKTERLYIISLGVNEVIEDRDEDEDDDGVE